MNRRKNNKQNSNHIGALPGALSTGLIRWLWKVSQWLKRFYLSKPWIVEKSEPLFLQLDRILVSRGAKGFVTYVKDLRRCLFGYLSGNQQARVGVRCTKDGIPVVFDTLIPLIREARTAKETCRFLITLLTVSRCLTIGSGFNIDPITCTGKYREPSLVGRYALDFWKHLRYRSSSQRVPKQCRWTSFHMSAKSGPNGHALWTSLIDLSGMSDELISDLKIIGGEEFAVKLQTLRDGIKTNNIPPIIPLENKVTSRRGIWVRKLAHFPDKEDKVRVVGILDYFSQSALRPLHLYLFGVLRKIPQDCTFDQASFKEKIREWKVFHSLDLTNATDRFPISLIGSVLGGLLPESYVSAWQRVMSGMPFKEASLGQENIRYEVGNPMGAYSSWASFAVAHHYVMFYCCKELGIEWSTARYVLLGDDILIGDDGLASKYRDVMDILGVEISAHKSHSSPHFCEFAKRLIYKGEEISPFPLSALKQESKRYYSLTNLLLECENKGWVTSDVSLASLGYHSMVKSLPSRMEKKLFPRVYGCERILKCMQNPSLANDLIPEVVRYWGYSTTFSKFDGWETILGMATRSAYHSSDFVGKDGPPLGQLAEDLVIWLTTETENPGDAELRLNLIYCIPFLQIYGKVEEQYIRLRSDERKATERLFRQGQWPSTLRSLRLPTSDKVFTERKRDVRVLSSAILGKFLEREIQNFCRLNTGCKPVYSPESMFGSRTWDADSGSWSDLEE